MVKIRNLRKRRKSKLQQTRRVNVREPLSCSVSRRPPKTKRKKSGGQRKVKLHPHVQTFIDYCGHKHYTPSLLRNASLHSFPLHRQSVYGRFTVTTNAAGLGWIVFNPYYLFQSYVVFNSSTAIAPVIYSGATWSGTLGSTLGDTTTGVSNGFCNDGVLQTSTFTGNAYGKHRCLGLTMVVRYLGTELNRGGEVFIVENAEMVQLIGNTFTFATITAWRDSHKYLIGPEAIAHNHTGRCSQELDFQVGQVWGNTNDTPSGSTSLPNLTGEGGNIGGNLYSMSGADSAPQGWNVGIFFNAAGGSQNFEVEVHGHYEGEFRFTNGATAYSHESIANANPAQFAAIGAATAAKNQMAVGTTKGSPQFMDTLTTAATAAFAPVVTTGLEWLADAAMSLFL